MAGSMFENAIASVELGVLDYNESKTDPRRGLSATRNLYAGVLLLLKEALHREAPELIWARLKPERKDGGIIWVGKGKMTADFQDLQERWKGLGMSFDWQRLASLRKVRNNVEHHYHPDGEAALRQAVADTFTLVVQILRDHLKSNPASEFAPEIWEVMIHEARTQQELKIACVNSRSAVVGVPDEIRRIWSQIRCDQCGSELLHAPVGAEYPDFNLDCQTCGTDLYVPDLVVDGIQEAYAVEAYEALKDGGQDPVVACPNCNEDAYLVEEDRCMLCDESKTYENCNICGTPLGVDEQDDGGLCSYHAYTFSKDD